MPQGPHATARIGLCRTGYLLTMQANLEPGRQRRSRAAVTRARGLDQRSSFDRLAASASSFVSKGPVFALVVLLICSWGASRAWWHSTASWEGALHTFSSVISLLLLVLLENSTRRNQEALQEKLNVLAEAMLYLVNAEHAQPQPDERLSGEDDRDRAIINKRLSEAIGLESRH